MLRYQSVGNGYQRSYNWLLAFTSEEHVGEQIQLDSDIGWRLDGISSARLLALSRHTHGPVNLLHFDVYSFKIPHTAFPLTCANTSESWLAAAKRNAVLYSALKWPEHWLKKIPAPTDIGSQPNQHCKRSLLLRILTWANCKTPPIAIGHKPDLLFNMGVKRLKASDLEMNEAVFHFRGMWTETKKGRLSNYHHYLTLHLCGIF